VEAVIASILEKTIVGGAFVYLLFHFVNRFGSALDKIGTQMENIASTLFRINTRLDNVETRLDKLEEEKR
jgi:hypothetical protein